MELPPLIERIGDAALWSGDFQRGLRYRGRRPGGTSNHLLFATGEGSGRLGHGAGWVTLPARSLAVICPGTAHDYGTDPTVGHWDFRWVHAAIPESWVGLINWPEPSPGIRVLQLPYHRWRMVWDAFGRLHRHLGRRHRHAMTLAYATLAEVLLLCDVSPAREDDARIRLACQHALDHLAEPLTVAALARAAGMSEVRFAHCFKDEMGLPPRRWLERQRLDRAAVLLADGTLAVAAVAALCGFPDPFHFSTRFRLRYGYSPKLWRNRIARPPRR